MKKIKVILADDHAILRYGISTLLAQSDDIEVVGEASKGDECITLFKNERPDVSIIDICMPGKSGLDVVHAIRDIDPNAKILILSMHSEQSTIQQFLETNINGYLQKSCPKRKVLQAVRSIANGQPVFSDSILKIKSAENKAANEQPINNITAREREILELVVDGYSSPQIAKKLYISRRTVDTHRNNLMQKLNIHNTASLVRYAIENHLVTTD